MEPGAKKVSFHTLGCKLNFSETSTIARQFEEGGFVRTPSGKDADICVINTCSVTDHADKKCRNLIRRLTRLNPEAVIAVTGCYAQLKPGDISAIEGVDIVLGNNDKDDLYKAVSELSGKGRAKVHSCSADELTNFFRAFSTGDRTRAFLKVQDGCSYKCSYCTIPYARGESRNIPVAEIVAQAEAIARAGQKEIVITGINTGDFGRTTGESFIGLLRALETVEGIERYRISSIEPNLLTDETIAFTAASAKFMPHFHIPLQSGSDNVLARMRRRYTTSMFAERIDAVRQAMPDAFIGIDVIVGFPGEADDDFETTCDFLAGLRPAFLHVFPYSVRPGTPAADFADKVPPPVAAARVKRLSELSSQLHRNFSKNFTGTQRPVLFESTVRGGMISGFTDNYLKVNVPYDRRLINRIVGVSLAAVLPDGDISGAVIDAGNME